MNIQLLGSSKVQLMVNFIFQFYFFAKWKEFIIFTHVEYMIPQVLIAILQYTAIPTWRLNHWKDLLYKKVLYLLSDGAAF